LKRGRGGCTVQRFGHLGCCPHVLLISLGHRNMFYVVGCSRRCWEWAKFGTLVCLWQRADVATCRRGNVQVWQCAGVATCWCGNVLAWRFVGVATCWRGNALVPHRAGASMCWCGIKTPPPTCATWGVGWPREKKVLACVLACWPRFCWALSNRARESVVQRRLLVDKRRFSLWASEDCWCPKGAPCDLSQLSLLCCFELLRKSLFCYAFEL
jgi:hypothetical protein